MIENFHTWGDNNLIGDFCLIGELGLPRVSNCFKVQFSAFKLFFFTSNDRGDGEWIFNADKDRIVRPLDFCPKILAGVDPGAPIVFTLCTELLLKPFDPKKFNLNVTCFINN